MQLEEQVSETQASTTQMISTSGDHQNEVEETSGLKAGAVSDSDEDQMLEDDESSVQKLDSFDKFGRAFVRALIITVEDVGANDNHRQKFLDVLADCFTHVIRLSNSITGSQGAVNALSHSFVSQIAFKASQIGESIAQTENFQEDNQEAIDRAAKSQTKKLMQEILSVYAQRLAAWQETTSCSKTVSQARALIELATKLRSASKDKLNQDSQLTEQILALGESLLSMKNAPKRKVLQKVAKIVYKSLLQGEADSKAVLTAKSDNLFHVLLAGLLLVDTPGDAELSEYLSHKSNTVAFNDKNLDALTDIHFFRSFYENTTEEVLLAKLLPQAVLACNRQASFLSNAAYLVNSINFKLSAAASVLIVSQLVRTESLEAGDKVVSDLLAHVCQKLDLSEISAFESQVLRDILLKSAVELSADTTTGFQKKINVMSASFDCIRALGANTPNAFLVDAIEAFLGLLMSDKEDATVAANIVQVCSQEAAADTLQTFIESNHGKISSSTQANFIIKVLPENAPQAWKTSLCESVQRTLLQQNFQNQTNYSQLLGLMALVNKLGAGKFVQMFNSESQVSQWITSGRSIVGNLQAYFSKLPSLADVTNHLSIIKTLLHNSEAVTLPRAQTKTLTSALLEYATNQVYTFRSDSVYRTFEAIAKRDTEAGFKLLEALFVKQSEIADRKPAKPVIDEEGAKSQNTELQRRLVNLMQILIPELVQNSHDLSYDRFTLVLQCLCHPLACPDKRSLKQAFSMLQQIVTEEKLQEMLLGHSEQLIEQFLKRRTGILSDNSKVRHIAQNVLVFISWAGFLEKLLPQMVPIFEYKPIQMLNKMEFILKQEFDTISHYDLMFYSEMSKDLIRLFSTRDIVSEQRALRMPDQAAEEEKGAPADVEEPKVQADLAKPMDLAAALAAKRGKKSKDAKKAKKATKGKAPSANKPAAAASSASTQQKQAPSAPVETKEERNKNDRKQLLSYVEQLKAIKAAHIATCQQILLLSNECSLAERLNYQDKTLNYTIDRLLKLLNLSATKFSSQFFLDNLLNCNPDLPFFKIKTSIITCLMAIAQDRLTIRTTQEFQNCLVFLEETANFSEMEGGYLKLTLTIANYVLKDMSVNLSVKEIGLQVTQSILDTNTEVETIDIVRLTINMLKTNYISSNLGLFIRKLMQRCSRLEIAMLLQRLFEYQPVPRKTLLTEILNYDEPLFCPVWLQTLLWVLLSDDDLSSTARKIWNKFGFYLQPEAVKIAHEKEDQNMFHYLRSPNFSIFDLTVRATAAAIELFQFTESSSFIYDIIQFYDEEWKIIEKLSFEATEDDYNKDQKVQMGLIGDDRTNRIAAPKILKLVARFVKQQDMEAVLKFFLAKACLDSNNEVSQAASSAAVELIQCQAPQHANALLAILETFIKDETASAEVKNQAIILLATLAPFLEDTSAKKLQATLELLFELSNSVQSEMVRQSICKCIPQLSRFMPDKSKIYLREQLAIVQESREEAMLKGAAYNAAGLFKAKGMKTLQEMDILRSFGNSYFQSKRADHVRKLGALNLFEALSFSMGRSFELYLEIVFPHILSSISDQKEVVREASLSALKRIMANFSNHAIRNALPQFLAQLETDNWRSKISTVEALGNMAFCAPKQISGFLPQIVKGLREVMNDTHEKVHEAAIQAISKIGSVIKCPEVGDMLEIIIRALANTTKHLKEALNLLLETSFVHKIDAPSLSLLVPLLDSGLMMHDNQSKQMAAQLMGNICSLTSDPSDLLPYMSILMPAIKNSLFDSIPEIRASSAKAMGSLAKGLGIENSLDMLSWLREFLNNTTIQSNERLGSAQGFAEIISAHGVHYFEVNVEEVIIKAKDADGVIREAYRSVLLFLANSFEQFSDYLPKLVPLMIEGLADDKDEVRKVSMRNVKVCIKQFGKAAPNQLVMPVMRMMFNPDSRVRASSSILMYQLVKELENDIIKAQPKYIEMDTKHRILSSMFILRHDQIEAVKTQAGQIWKSIVDNQLFILRQVIDTLIEIVFNIIQNPSIELQEMGLSCMRGLVEKFGEKLVNRALDIFERKLDTATETNQSVGICKVMFNMVSASSHRLLILISPRMISIMEGHLSSENDTIRDWSTRVFVTMFQRQPDKNFIDPTLKNIIIEKLRMYNLENRTEDAQRLIKSLKLMISSAKELRLQDKLLRLCEITNREEPFSIAQAQVIGALAPTIASQVFHKRNYTSVMHSLEEELNAEQIDSEERIQHVLMAYAELMSQIPPEDFSSLSEQLMAFNASCIDNNRPEFYVDFISHFCANTKCDIEGEAVTFLENVLRYMNHEKESLIEKVIAAMTAIFNKVSKETQFSFVPIIKASIENVCVQFVGCGSPLLEQPLEHRYQKKVPFLTLLGYPAGVKCLVEVAQAAIMHGNIQVRTDAAYCFKYILDFAKDLGKGEIVKICGALIRVANDRFPQELKVQIYYALRFIQTKGGPSAKGFQVNMQTTYTKAIGDPASTSPSRRIILENLILLVSSLPRIDPIVKDLNALIDGTKIDGDQKTSVSECLALIIRTKGKAISSAISQTIYRTMTDIIQEQQGGGTNDRIYANCATALAFLSAYASNASQMQTLFTAFDESAIDAIILPLKFAILINGNDTIDKSQLLSDFQTMLVERLTDSAGFEEIDDDPSPINTEDEVFRFRGVLDTISFMLDRFARRDVCQKPDSAIIKMVYQSINQSAIFRKLQQEDSIGLDSYKLLCKFAAEVPIKPIGGAALTNECGQMTRDIFDCLQKFYLDFLGQALQDTQDALLNILQLNYDNYTDYSDTLLIQTLTKPIVKTAVEAPCMQGVISDDMKLYAVDILFKKK